MGINSAATQSENRPMRTKTKKTEMQGIFHIWCFIKKIEPNLKPKFNNQIIAKSKKNIKY